MAKQYEFTDYRNWEPFWSETFTAQPVNPALRRYYPIGRVGPNYLLETPIIAVNSNSVTAERNWRYAARYYIKISTGITVNGGVPETVIKVGKLYLNQIEIIRIPEFASAFSLEIDVPFWHEQISFNVWEYIGSDVNTLQEGIDRIIAATNA